MDDASNSAAQAFGLPAFPFSVFVDSNGVVAGRATGAIPMEIVIQAAIQTG